MIKKIIFKLSVMLVSTMWIGCILNLNIYDNTLIKKSVNNFIEVNNIVQIPDKRLKLSEIRQINDDAKAWINIPGTTIDWPIMKWIINKNDKKPFYDRKDEYKNYAFEGSIYGGEGVNFTPLKLLSNNLVLYGHNLDDNPYGKKFAQLVNFQNIEFAKNTPYIFITTEDTQLIYQIYAVFFTDLDFQYYLVGLDEYSQNEIVNEAKKRSEYIYDVEVTGKDKIITLSTCTYRYGKYQSVGQENTRFVVQGKLIDSKSELLTTALLKVNPNPKRPNLPDNI